MNQRTIKQETSCEGTGLFTGEKVALTFRPADIDKGITFIANGIRIPASIKNASAQYRRTSIAQDGVEISTVEHLLATLHGLGITNLDMELKTSAPLSPPEAGKPPSFEIPNLDGSAKTLADLLISAGIQEQPAPRKVLKIRTPIHYSDGLSTIIALPSETDGLSIEYTLVHSAPIIGTQYLSIHITPEEFVTQLAPARTYCLADEIAQFQSQGLGKGATYQSLIVVDKKEIIQNQLRFKDEFVRHKILDLLGDLFLLNIGINGRIIANKSGHKQNLQFVQKLVYLLNNEIETLPPVTTTPSNVIRLDIREVQNILPHRYPFLLIDRVIEMDGYQRAVGIKNVSINEPYFQGHFPGRPIMPGVLQVEAMGQLAGALLLSRAGNENKLAVILSIDDAKFRRQVIPGDTLRIEAETVKIKARIVQVEARIYVVPYPQTGAEKGEIASEAKIKFMLVDKE